MDEPYFGYGILVSETRPEARTEAETDPTWAGDYYKYYPRYDAWLRTESTQAANVDFIGLVFDPEYDNAYPPAPRDAVIADAQDLSVTYRTRRVLQQMARDHGLEAPRWLAAYRGFR